MLTADRVLDEYFLEARCMLIETAATLDRYDRAVVVSGGAGADPRPGLLREAIALLAAESGAPDRAERLLALFSDE